MNADVNESDLDEEGYLFPPWRKHPEIPLGSIGWRTGYGELYWYKFVDWFVELDTEEKQNYIDKYPKPESWKEFWPYIPDKLNNYANTNE